MARQRHTYLPFWLTIAVLFGFCLTAAAQGYPGSWVGKWIWNWGETHPFHFFLMARKSVDLDGIPPSAKLHITAADRYLLYVNGQYLGRGPARSDPQRKSYDTYSVAAHPGAGKNCIAVLAYHYGASHNYRYGFSHNPSRDSRAGLFVQLELTRADGTRQMIGTDKNWRVRPARGWRRDVSQISQHIGAVGMTEVYDANLDPPDWFAPSFDDSSWKPAHVIPDREGPWRYLEPRQTPMLREEEVFPARIVKVGEAMDLGRMFQSVADFYGAGRVPERLTAEPLFPLQYTTVENPQAVLCADGEAAHIKNSPYRAGDPPEKGIRSPYVLLDFGRQVFGFPRVRLSGPAGAVVEMTYSQTLGRPLGFESNPLIHN